MSKITFSPSAPKKPVNLSINAELLQQSRQLNINLSQTFEQHLAEDIRQAQRRLWLAGNKFVVPLVLEEEMGLAG